MSAASTSQFATDAANGSGNLETYKDEITGHACPAILVVVYFGMSLINEDKCSLRS
jgi:hypothetical protein